MGEKSELLAYLEAERGYRKSENDAWRAMLTTVVTTVIQELRAERTSSREKRAAEMLAGNGATRAYPT